MKKIKTLLIVVSLLVATALGAGIFFLDNIVNGFRPQIQAALSNSLRTEVSFGELSSSVFPSVAIKLSDVALKQAGNESQGVNIENLYLKTSISDLLTGSISVSELKVENASTTIVREKNSVFNVGGIQLGKQGAKNSPKPPPAEKGATKKELYPALPSPALPLEKSPNNSSATPTPDAKKSAVRLKIKRADIVGMTITLVDQAVSPAQTIELKDLNATLENIDAAGSAKIALTASLLGLKGDNISVQGLLGNPLANLPLDVNIELNDLDLKHLLNLARVYGTKLDKLTLKNGMSLGLSLKSIPGGIQSNFQLNAKDSSISFAELFSKTNGETLSLSLDASTTLLGSVDANAIKIALGKNTVNATAKASPSGLSSASLAATSFDLSDLARFAPPAKPYKLKGSLGIDVDSSVDASGKIVPSGKVSLAEVGATYSAGKDRELHITALNGTVNLEAKKIKAAPLSLRVAEQPLEAKAVYSLSTNQVAYNLQSEEFKLWPILSAVKPDLEKLKSSFFAGIEIQGTHSLTNNSGEVSVTAKKSSLADVSLEKTSIKAKYSNERIALEPSSLSLFGGTLNANATSESRGDKTFNANLSGSDLNAETISQTLLPDSPIGLEGNIDSLKTNLTGSGKSPTKTISGPANLLVTNGAITGFNLLGDLLKAISAIPGVTTETFSSAIPEDKAAVLESSSTQFDSMVAEVLLGDGRANLTQVKLTHSLYIVDGTGALDLLSGNMKIAAKMRLTPLITEKLILRQPKLKLLLDRNGNLVVPLTIKKSGGNVKVLPDTDDLAKRAAQNTAREAAGRALDKVAPGVGGVLDSLF